jgi:hypothetical protein
MTECSPATLNSVWLKMRPSQGVCCARNSSVSLNLARRTSLWEMGRVITTVRPSNMLVLFLILPLFDLTGLCKGKGKAIPLHTWTDPEGFRRLRLPDFKTVNTLMWYDCQPYTPVFFTPHAIYLVFISVWSWVDPTAIVRPEGLYYWKVPMTPSEIEPANF